jgi:ketosteroid isomerase-like protein
MFNTKEELYGRDKVADYFRQRYFHQASPAHLEIRESAFHAIGEAVWYEYEFSIDMAEGRLRGRGMAMCKKSDGHWRMASMHHSEIRFEPAGAPGEAQEVNK